MQVAAQETTIRGFLPSSSSWLPTALVPSILGGILRYKLTHPCFYIPSILHVLIVGQDVHIAHDDVLYRTVLEILAKTTNSRPVATMNGNLKPV